MATTSRIRYRKMAKAVRRACNRYFNRGMKSWIAEDDHEMIDMYKDDRRDLRRLATLINQGQIKRAAKLIGKLDTAVYEEIPCYVYDYIGERYGF